MKAVSTVTLPPGFRSKFLDALTPTEVKAVLAAAREERTLPRQVLQRQGELAHRLCLPLTGRVANYRLLDDGSKLFVRWGLPGDIFGLWTLLAEPSTYQLTVEAVQEGSLLTWDRASSRMFIGQFPNLLKAVHSLAAGAMDDFIDVLAIRASLTVPRRLAQMLVKSASQIGRVGSEGIELDFTNEQLALVAQVGLFTACRQLSKWQALGIVRKKRGKILLRSLPRLENIAKDGNHRP